MMLIPNLCKEYGYCVISNPVQPIKVVDQIHVLDIFDYILIVPLDKSPKKYQHLLLSDEERSESARRKVSREGREGR